MHRANSHMWLLSSLVQCLRAEVWPCPLKTSEMFFRYQTLAESLYSSICSGPVPPCRHQLTFVNCQSKECGQAPWETHNCNRTLTETLAGLMMPRGDCGDLWALVFISWHRTQQLAVLWDWEYWSWIQDQYLYWTWSPFSVSQPEGKAPFLSKLSHTLHNLQCRLITWESC